MRGAGEAVFENDHPPGTDVVKGLQEGPHPRERFELEVARRPRGFV